MNVETPLREGLRALARQAPAVAVPEDFFDQVHVRARQRRAVRSSAVVVTLLALAVGLVFRPTGSGTVTPGGPVGVTAGLPHRLHTPPIWTASVELSPPGTAAMIFGGEATLGDWNEGRFAIVAADSDRYRVFNEFTYTPPGFEALLSPDGELIARNRTVRSLHPERDLFLTLPGNPRAFSPDGSLLVYETGDGVNYVNDVEYRPSRIGVYDLARRVEIASIDNSDSWLTPGWSVALSPDNSRLAVQLRDEIRLYRLGPNHPVPYATVKLDAETLAGPGSWLPDGRSFVTARRYSGENWRLVLRNADTGQAGQARRLPEVAGARYIRVLGWRVDGTAVAVTGVPRPNTPPAPIFHESAWGPFRDLDTVRVRLITLTPNTPTATVLFETPTGVSELDVAADLAVAGLFRDPGRPEYGPLPTTIQLVGGVLLMLICVPLLWLVWRARRRTIQRGTREYPGPTKLPTRNP
ncbi:hypothetical protein AB0873_31855 [Micromonospora sp. NPDC047707]|uniref:hypothetical protein n=1 Tax=Micromonospora sp. NPDC047707 TaxID=3154498 RepID=UPI003454107D